MLIRVPEVLTERDAKAARASLIEKRKPGDFAAVRLETMDEG